MYHELTEQQRKNQLITRGLAVLCVFLIIVAFALAFFLAQYNTREQSALSIRQTVLDVAMQCAAVEGSFPSSLTYLEDNYGLRINHNDYIVNYEVFAPNVVPSVVVTPR